MLYWNSYSLYGYLMGGFKGFLFTQIILLVAFIISVNFSRAIKILTFVQQNQLNHEGKNNNSA